MEARAGLGQQRSQCQFVLFPHAVPFFHSKQSICDVLESRTLLATVFYCIQHFFIYLFIVIFVSFDERENWIFQCAFHSSISVELSKKQNNA